MSSEVEAIAEEFRREIDAVRRLLIRAETAEDGAPIDATLRIAASNASLLLLAASFEEFIRELVMEFCSSLFRTATRFTDIPGSVAATVWDRSLYLLRGLGYGKPDFDRSAAALSIQILDEFCLNQGLTVDVTSLVGYNQNNMRAKEINDIFRRVGIKDICGLVGRRTSIINFFGAASPDISHARFVSHLDEFYENRNEVAHSIGSIRGTGAVQVSRHLEFFECTSSAFAAVIKFSY
jgi:RiboL-PSP-HEPN